MILKTVEGIELDSSVESINAGISIEGMPFLFKIVSRSYYSRKIDSIVREITSNCFDSHIEAKVDKAVVIEKEYDKENDCYNIIFKDFGVGLSVDRIMNIYNSWFDSTKRDSNDQIGAFGLGSKSPFSYTDAFNIKTWYNGYEYYYYYVLTDTYPKLISLYDYDTIEEGGITTKIPKGIPTDKPNGTEIIIQLINNEDYLSFQNSIKKELCYFDNVYVKGFPDIDNHYSIYRMNNFLYRSDNQYSDKLHVVLGKVSYPIDWDAIDREPIFLPFGIIFDIGDLQVTPNRENLVYDDYNDERPIAKLINSKIDKVLEEVNNLVSKSGQLETNDLLFYLKNRDARPSITFGNKKVFINKEYLNGDVTLYYTPLKEFQLAGFTIPNDYKFIYRPTHIIENGKLKEHNYSNYNKDIIIKDAPFDNYTNLYIHSGSIFKLVSLKKDYHFILNKLEVYSYKQGRYNRSSASYYQVDKDLDYELDIKTKQYKIKQIRLDKAKYIKQYIDHIRTIVDVANYSDYTPTDEWILNYKKEQKEQNLAYKRKLNKEIVCKVNGYRRVFKLIELAKYTNVIYDLYSNKNYRYSDELNKYEQKLSNIKSLTKPTKFVRRTEVKDGKKRKIYGSIYDTFLKENFIFIEVAASNLSILKELTNVTQASLLKDWDYIKKYDQLKTNYDYINSILYKFHHIHDFIDENSYYKKLKEYRLNILNKFVNIYDYKSDIKEPTEEVKLLCKRAMAELIKLDILNYINSNMPREYLNPITSKLKTNILNENLLSINEPQTLPKVEQYKELLIF